MEKELSKILDKIELLYFDEDIDDKQKELLELWTKYYQLSHSYGIELTRAYDLYLLGENVSYVVDAKLNYKKDLEVPFEIIDKLKNIIDNNKSSNILNGISMDEANILLTWLVNRTWKNLSYFGIDMSRNSLNGFCEIAQISTLYPLEQLGLKVTKNTANGSFDYLFHHAFGTVTIPINDCGIVTDEMFLIDPTYKQFFTAVRCNHGRYYAKEVAKIYGDGFKKASISLENYHEYSNINNDGGYYIDRIKNSSGAYCTDLDELDDYAFEIDIPNDKNIINK